MTDLGDLVDEYKGRPWRSASAAALSGALAVAGFWAIGAMKPKDPGKAWLIVLLFAAIAAVFVVLAIRDAKSRLRLHARGLVFERGSTRTELAYVDVAAVNEYRVNGKA